MQSVNNNKSKNAVVGKLLRYKRNKTRASLYDFPPTALRQGFFFLCIILLRTIVGIMTWRVRWLATRRHFILWLFCKPPLFWHSAQCFIAPPVLPFTLWPVMTHGALWTLMPVFVCWSSARITALRADGWKKKKDICLLTGLKGCASSSSWR